jgi:hypothetical protein
LGQRLTALRRNVAQKVEKSLPLQAGPKNRIAADVVGFRKEEL